jgi:hypothetical protein
MPPTLARFCAIDNCVQLKAWQEMTNLGTSSSGKFDGVIDFDAAIRDPAHPASILPAFDDRELPGPGARVSAGVLGPTSKAGGPGPAHRS